jgi:hypothetical protein
MSVPWYGASREENELEMELKEISKCYIVVKPLAVYFIAAVLHIEEKESEQKLFQTNRDAKYLMY